jgi:hypothetical protein
MSAVSPEPTLTTSAKSPMAIIFAVTASPVELSPVGSEHGVLAPQRVSPLEEGQATVATFHDRRSSDDRSGSMRSVILPGE